MQVSKNGVVLQRPDSEYYYWTGAGWTVIGYVDIPPMPVAVIDDSWDLSTLQPPKGAAGSAEHSRAMIFALLGTTSFRDAVASLGVGGGVRFAQDADGVYYPSAGGPFTVALDADGVYYPKGA